ncbi:MAG: hypothetical protein AAF648_15605 [Pseudomonadota bacterium]
MNAGQRLSAAEAEGCFADQRVPFGANGVCCSEAAARRFRSPLPLATGPHWVHLEGDEGQWHALLAVPEALDCFRGHFPGQPILPGVLQLAWAEQLATVLWPQLAVAKLLRVKFREPVAPPAVLRFVLTRHEGKIAVQVERPGIRVADWTFHCTLTQP